VPEPCAGKLARTVLRGRKLPGCLMLRETVKLLNNTEKDIANAHLAHLQAPTHRLNLQLAKEPNFCRR